MNEPIVIWPPGSFYTECSEYGAYYDCTYDYPELANEGARACCPAF